MQEQTALQTLYVLPTTKQQMESFVAQAVHNIIDGNYNFKELIVNKKIWLDTITAIYDHPKVKAHLEDEFEKEKQKEIGYNNATIKLTNRKNWDYSNTGDSHLEALENKLDEVTKPIKDAIKERQKLLQSIKQPIADTTTGEVVNPATFTTTSFFTVAIK